MKVGILLERKDVDILTTTQTMHYQDDANFTSANGLNFAIAFTAYDSESEWILDPTYGELVVNSYAWGPDSNSDSTFLEEKPIETHICSKEELGLSPDR